MFYSTRAKNHSQQSLMAVKSNETAATTAKCKLGSYELELTSDSIFISLLAKCNRSKDFIYPVFGNNYAPTWNNRFLVQKCSSEFSSCNIPTASFIEVEGCDSRSGNIGCFTK